MDIPALSMAMAQYNINSQVGVAMLDKSLDMSAVREREGYPAEWTPSYRKASE